MAEQSSLALPKELSVQYEDAMRRNLAALMRSRQMNQSQLKLELERRGLSVQQGNLSQYLSGRKSIPLSIIVHLCDIFQISLPELVGENFGGARQVGGSQPVGQVYSDDLLQVVPYLGDKFVVDPADSHFSGYLQTYYVYYFASKGDDIRLRTGTLRLQARDAVCEAVLEINTNKLRNGSPFIKTYRGRCIISTTMRTVFLLLTDQETGELSVVNFRYHALSTYPLDCRVACTILNATGVEHPPVMQRLFLSRTEIREEHLPLLQTHLFLNGSIITVCADQLEALRSLGEGYERAVDELLRTNQPRSVYFLEEDDVLSIARRCLREDGVHLRNPEDPAVNRFFASLRSLAEHNRFNKASRQADHLARRFLRSLGYYHDHEYDN